MVFPACMFQVAFWFAVSIFWIVFLGYFPLYHLLFPFASSVRYGKRSLISPSVVIITVPGGTPIPPLVPMRAQNIWSSFCRLPCFRWYMRRMSSCMAMLALGIPIPWDVKMVWFV